jgi:chaperonin cofactor prefoldin
MELLEQDISALAVSPATAVEDAERAARRSLRFQIAKLERELSNAFLTSYSMGDLHHEAVYAGEQPRLLGLAELEQVRDELAERLRAARLRIARVADQQEATRVRLERMLLQPGKHRFERISLHDLGEPGCGVWHVRPRLGLIGMLMGWWQVKLSSGCPLAWGRGGSPRPVS